MLKCKSENTILTDENTNWLYENLIIDSYEERKETDVIWQVANFSTFAVSMITFLDEDDDYIDCLHHN